MKIFRTVLSFMGILLTSEAAKLLLVPTDHGAHVNFFSVIGQTLKAAGHDVYVAVPLQHLKIVSGYKLNAIPMNFSIHINFIQEEVGDKGNDNIMFYIWKMIGFIENQTRELIADKTMMKTLKDHNFDLMLMDGSILSVVKFVLPYKLSVPYVSISVQVDPFTYRVPSLPSIEGAVPFFHLNSQSTIIDRITNTLVFVGLILLSPASPLSPVNDRLISELVPEKPNIGYRGLLLQSEIVLINFDVIGLDYPRVSSPFYKYIGGIGAKPPSPLPKDLEKIMLSSKNGVIVLTFGSGMKTLPYKMLIKFMEVFKTIKQTIIMRHNNHENKKEEPLDIPPNVHVMTWLPQNDLLGHPNTKIFITHAGNNGQLEAVYHGVPVLVMPLFGDQPYNARRAVQKGFGKELDPHTFTTTELHETITELLNNRTYYENIHKCSLILHDLPNPQDETLFWIEHVLKFGGSHLKPYYLNMPMWKFFMFDVAMVFVAIFFCLYFCLKWCVTRFCCSRKVHAKRD